MSSAMTTGSAGASMGHPFYEGALGNAALIRLRGSRRDEKRKARRRRLAVGSGDRKGKKGVGGNFLEKRGNVWNEKESFTLSSNRRTPN